MTNGRKIALALVAVTAVVAGYFVFWGLRASSLTMSCEREVVDHKASPDGRLKAEIIDIDCGATTAFETRVLIADAARSFDDVHDEAAHFRGTARRLEWEGTRLQVFYGDADPTSTPASFRGTAISYLNDE